MRDNVTMLEDMLNSWVLLTLPVQFTMFNWTRSWGPASKKDSYRDPRAATFWMVSMVAEFSALELSRMTRWRPRVAENNVL